MPTPTYQLLVARTRTGAVVDAIEGGTWSADDSLVWSDAGKLSITVPLPGRDRAGQITRSTLRGIANDMSGLSIAVIRDATCLWAGPAVTLGWNRDASSVQLGCSGLGWIFDRRMLVAPGYLADPTNPAADITVSLLPRDLVLELLARATSGLTRRQLPLTIPTQSGVVGDPITYTGGDLRTAHEAIKDTSEADGGPDIALTAELSADQSAISWTARVGAPRLGGLSTATWDYPMIAISGDIDDSETCEYGYVPGDSTASSSTTGDESRYIGVGVRDRGEPYPLLERVDRTSVSEKRPDRLTALAASYVGEYSQASEEIALAVPSDDGPLYRAQYELGDSFTGTITGHPWLDDLVATRRLISVGITTEQTTLTTTGPRLTGSAP